MKKANIGILTFPISEAGTIPLSNLVDILHSVSNDFYLITGNAGYIFFKENEEIHTYGVRHETGANVFTRIIRYIYTQLRLSYKLATIAKNIDLCFFFLGEDSLVLPILIAKLLRKNVVLVTAGTPEQALKRANDSLLFVPMKIISKINYALANKIILYSENLIKQWNLQRYRNKICIAHTHFLDFNNFNVSKKLNERENLVGYRGRFSEEKGTLNLVEAIPEILKEKDDLKFLIGGDGELRDKIKGYLNKENLNDKVKLGGWIPQHDELPNYLNELKLIVFPSYREGLPNTMLEAMACGTPVLATPVGAIPDVIEDGETGFIMENNSPECIAENVMRALNHPDLEKIVKNARELIEREFTYGAAVERYREILKELS